MRGKKGDSGRGREKAKMYRNNGVEGSGRVDLMMA